jgi:hypothetical protein
MPVSDEPQRSDGLRRILDAQRQLAGSLADPAAAQRRVLDEALGANAGTAFAAHHHLQRVRDADDFRAAVPIRGYEDFEPWIARAAAGESNVLTTEDPVVFLTSSGSTGAPKKIPVTPSFARSCMLPFLHATYAGVIQRHPALLARGDATLSLKYDPAERRSVTASGRPHIGMSQVDFRLFGEPVAEPGTRAPWAALPDELGACGSLESLYHRVRLAAEHDVRCIVGINPAQVAALVWLVERWAPDIVREIHDGTLAGRPHRRPNPLRAGELQRLAMSAGVLLPAHLWPRLEVIVCWNTGLASHYLPRVREAYGAGVRIHPAPVAASEGPIGLPLDDHPTAGPLVVSSVFYEFVPAHDPVEATSATLLYDELELHAEYHVLLTHVGGLYRYALGDVVRVVGFVGGVPRVEYAGRSTTLSAAGERLRESEVVRAIGAACRRHAVELANGSSRLDPDWSGTPRYEFLIAPRRPLAADGAGALAVALDDALCEISDRYARARAGAALAPACLHLATPEAFAREWEHRVGEGNRPPQVKDRVFWRDDSGWRRIRHAELVASA